MSAKKDRYDAVVIGGGHNGLTAASVLGKRGLSVLVIEKNKTIGGLCAKEEFHPGYFNNGLLHDTSTIRSNVMSYLKLESHGLKIDKSRPSVTFLSANSQSITIETNLEKTVESITRISEKDGQAYREYYGFIEKLRPFVLKLLSESPPDISNFSLSNIFSLLRKGISFRNMGKKTMLEFIKVAPMSVMDFLDEKFETDLLKAGLAAPSIYGSFTSPRSAYTTLNLLLWECCSLHHIQGGPSALIESLRKSAEQTKVEIITDLAATNILIDENKMVRAVRLSNGDEIATKEIYSSTDLKATFFDLIKNHEIDYSIESSVDQFRTRGTTAKINLALNKKIKFGDPELGTSEYVRTGDSLWEMEKAFDPVKYKQFSSTPILDIYVPSRSDHSCAPDSCDVLSILVHYVPYHLDESWNDSSKKKLLKAVMKTLDTLIPDVSKSVVGSQVLTPKDIENKYGISGGHIYHGEHAVDQLFPRPFPQFSGYTTPIDGLILCGSSSYPGGGITCAPGYLAATR